MENVPSRPRHSSKQKKIKTYVGAVDDVKRATNMQIQRWARELTTTRLQPERIVFDITDIVNDSRFKNNYDILNKIILKNKSNIIKPD